MSSHCRLLVSILGEQPCSPFPSKILSFTSPGVHQWIPWKNTSRNWIGNDTTVKCRSLFLHPLSHLASPTAPIPSRSSLIPGSRLRLLLHQGVMFLLFLQTWQPRYHLSTTEKQQNALHYNILLRPFSSSHHHTFAYTMHLSSCPQTFLTSTLRWHRVR